MVVDRKLAADLAELSHLRYQPADCAVGQLRLVAIVLADLARNIVQCGILAGRADKMPLP